MGLGSIGVRHLLNLVEILEERNVEYTIDAFRSTNGSIDKRVQRYISKEIHSVDELETDYDIGFITNLTNLHYDSVLIMQNKAKNLFIEKPVFDRTDLDLKTLKMWDGVFYVACPLRYTKVIKYLKEYIENKKILSVRVICSSYLPGWRQNVDYRKTCSAKKNLGGGVSIDLIHEWDYVIHLFGKPENICKMQGKYSDLEINVEDVAMYLASYSDKLVSVHLDYFGRIPRREIEIFTEEDVIVGDLIKNKVRFLKQEKEIDLKEDRNEFQKRELLSFLSMIDGNSKNTNTIDFAMETLKIAKDEY